MSDLLMWVPVSERMPEVDELVLLCQEYAPNPILHLGSWWGNYWWSENDRSEIEDVTHWLPIPEVPTTKGRRDREEEVNDE